MPSPRLVSAREYRAWYHMIARCENPRNEKWAYYGGRGITVAPIWRHSFQRFLDDMGPCPPGFTLDRINNDGPYAPGNCRWADRVTQNRNTRANRLVSARGLTLTVPDWAERTGIPAHRLNERLRAGWSTERALDPTPRIGHTQSPEHIARRISARNATMQRRRLSS